MCYGHHCYRQFVDDGRTPVMEYKLFAYLLPFSYLGVRFNQCKKLYVSASLLKCFEQDK